MEHFKKPPATEQFHLYAKEELLRTLQNTWEPENPHVRDILHEATPADIRLYIADRTRGILGMRIRIHPDGSMEIDAEPVNRAIRTTRDLFQRHLIVSACMGGILWEEEGLREAQESYRKCGGAYIDPDTETEIRRRQEDLDLLRSMLRFVSYRRKVANA